MNIKIYIDFDGVILDTWEIIFTKYQKKFNTEEIDEIKLKKVMLEIGWESILKNSREINNSLEKIKQLNKKQNVCVLSKVNSEEEEKAKREYLLENGINAMCFVPYISSKTQFVEVKGNILIDDDLKNLNDWQNRGGIPIFFNENLDNYDSYGKKNDKYLITNDLLKIYDLIKIYDII